MEMTTDMLAPEELFATAAPATPAELNPLTLLTIKPEEYVAQVFAPFRSKLATLQAEADTIHFVDDRMYDAPHRYVDIGTTEGMAIAVKYRAALRREVRLDAKDAHSNRKAPILLIGRLLDSTLKSINDDVAPYEEKFDAAIKAEEKRKTDIAAAKERAKAERIGVIQAAIEAIRVLPARAAGKSSEELQALLERVAAREIAEKEFDQFADEARAALEASGRELFAMYGAAQQAEAAAAQAEADRKAAAKALEDQRIDQARIAAAQAAKEKELADAAAELQRQRDRDAATARAAQLEAERLAKVEADKVAAANAAAAKKLADDAKALADREAAFQRRLDDIAATEAKAKQDAIDAEAARQQEINDALDAADREAEEATAREAERVRLQALADEALAAGRERQNDEHVAGLPAGSLGVAALTDALVADEVTDEDIIKLIADEYGMSILGAVNRVAAIDFDAARTLAEAA